MTHSCAGGLLIGCLITTTDECTVTGALELYKSLIPADIFHVRGQKRNCVFMADDSEAERKALQAAFPESKLLLHMYVSSASGALAVVVGWEAPHFSQ